MTQIKPLQPFVLTFPQDKDGKDVKYRFMLTLSKHLKQKIGDENIGSRIEKFIWTIDGIDTMSVGGRYSLEITIARTFDPDAVLAELKERLEKDILSEITRPPLILPA